MPTPEGLCLWGASFHDNCAGRLGAKIRSEWGVVDSEGRPLTIETQPGLWFRFRSGTVDGSWSVDQWDTQEWTWAKKAWTEARNSFMGTSVFHQPTRIP